MSSWGEGAIWEGVGGAVKCGAEGPINFELKIRVGQTTTTGVVQIQADINDTFPDLAAELADEWTRAEPIQDIFAVAQGATTAFFPTGDLAKLDPNGNPVSKVIEMAVTFPGRTRELLDPDAEWPAGKVRLTRATVNFVGMVQQMQAKTGKVTTKKLDEDKVTTKKPPVDVGVSR